MKSTNRETTTHKSRTRGASLLALCLCILLGLFMTACAPSGDGGSADASADAGSGAAHTDRIKGTAIDKWQDSYLISERDNEPHPVKVRFTSIDTDPAAVQEQIDAYNVSASGQMIPALDDPQYVYHIAHYEVSFPSDYPDGDYGITQVAPQFSICDGDGDDVITVGNTNYSGLTQTFEIGYQPRGYDFHAGDTYEGAIVYVMVNGYDGYRIVETAPAADGGEETHYYLTH